ncbi:MAG TPA: hypothetical protein VHY32_08435 [Caulobacteraceae bacterium]|jgi:hypothetical protein|nr:hypothetical protein [Caulobacteraceae bacterium]
MSDETFADGLSHARRLLRDPEPPIRVWPTVLAAVFFAVCALSFAAAAILAPPVQLTPVSEMRGPAN